MSFEYCLFILGIRGCVLQVTELLATFRIKSAQSIYSGRTYRCKLNFKKHRAYRAVIFAIAQLFCTLFVGLLGAHVAFFADSIATYYGRRAIGICRPSVCL